MYIVFQASHILLTIQPRAAQSVHPPANLVLQCIHSIVNAAATAAHNLDALFVCAGLGTQNELFLTDYRLITDYPLGTIFPLRVGLRSFGFN